MKATKPVSSLAKSSQGSKKTASSGSGSGGCTKGSNPKAACPEKRPTQPEGAGNVEAEVLAIRMRLQEEANQHERNLNALRRTHNVEMARALSNFTAKNNELVKANAGLRVEHRKALEGFKQLQISNHGLQQVVKRHEARFKEAGLSSSQPLKTPSARAAQPSENRANRGGESSGKGAAGGGARTGGGGAGTGGGAGRLTNIVAVDIEETLAVSPAGSPRGGKRRHTPKLDTVEEDAESEGTSAEGDEEPSQADSISERAPADAAAPTEPCLGDEVMGEGGSAREPRGKPPSPRGESEEIASTLVAFCTQFDAGTSRPSLPSSSLHKGQGRGASRALPSQLAAPSVSSSISISQLLQPSSSSSLPRNLPAGGGSGGSSFLEALTPEESGASQSSDSSAGGRGSDASAGGGGKREGREDDDSQEGKRARRRSTAVVSYAEPGLNAKLRQGCPNTFNSGYDTGIHTLTKAEQTQRRQKKQSQQRRQSLPLTQSLPPLASAQPSDPFAIKSP